MKHKLLLIIILLSFVANAKSEELPAIEHELEGRIGASISADFFDKTLGIDFSPQIRTKGIKYDKTLLRVGVNYDLLNIVNIGLGGRVIFNEKKKGTETTGRLDANLSRSFSAWKFKIKPRVRYSMYLEDENSINSLMRYKLTLAYKHKKRTLFEPQISVEAFQVLPLGLFSAFRYGAGGEFRINKHNFIEIEYLLDMDYGTRIAKHIVQIEYKYKF